MRNMSFRRGPMASALIPAALFTAFTVQASAQESAGEYFAREQAMQSQSAPNQAAQNTPRSSRQPRVRLASLSVNDAEAPRQSEAAQPLAASPSATPSSGIHALVTAAAVRNGISPALLHGVIRKESNYRCNAFNRRGQVHGVGQVKTATARSVGVHGSLYDCNNGVEAAARYLKLAIARGGAGCAGVSLYERGVYARPSCTAYGRTVMQMARVRTAS